MTNVINGNSKKGNGSSNTKTLNTLGHDTKYDWFSAFLDPNIAINRLIASGLSLAGVKEYGGNNKGQMVEMLQRFVYIKPGDPWCAAFVSWVGYWSQYDAEYDISHWPLPRTGGCQKLADDAAVAGMIFTTPRAGDIFLEYSHKKGRFGHTGIIVQVHSDNICTTIEGNSNADGSPEGKEVVIRQRKLVVANGDRFIHWTAGLDNYGAEAPTGGGR